MITKTDFDTKLSSLNRKITQNKTRHLLVENKLITLENKIQIIKTDYNIKIAEIDKNIVDVATKIGLLFLENMMFDGEDGFQVYLIFQPVYKYFKFITITNYISSWKSKGLSNESIKVVNAVFVARLLISGILFSNSVILVL